MGIFRSLRPLPITSSVPLVKVRVIPVCNLEISAQSAGSIPKCVQELPGLEPSRKRWAGVLAREGIGQGQQVPHLVFGDYGNSFLFQAWACSMDRR